MPRHLIALAMLAALCLMGCTTQARPGYTFMVHSSNGHIYLTKEFERLSDGHITFTDELGNWHDETCAAIEQVPDDQIPRGE